MSAMSLEAFFVVTPKACTSLGRLACAMATLFCTFTASMSLSVPSSKTTDRLYRPLSSAFADM